MNEKIVSVERVEDLIAVFGSFDENIRRIEDALGVNIVNRGNELKIVGEPEAVDKATRTLEGLLTIAARGETIDEQRVRYLLTLVQPSTMWTARCTSWAQRTPSTPWTWAAPS